MKFTTQLATFQKLLQKVMPALPQRNQYNDALDHISLSLVDNELTAVASDTEISIKSKTFVAGDSNGEVLIPAKKINEIVKVLDSTKDMHFECSTQENERGNTDFIIKINSGRGKFQVKGMNPDEYIELPEIFDAELPAVDEGNNSTAFFKKEVIQKLATQTHFAVSKDEYRQNMNGVLLQFRKSYANAVATDSFRLVRSTTFAAENEFPDEVDILVPARAIDICKKVDEDLIMLLDTENERSSLLRMDFGETIVVSRLISETFPKYEAIIPTTSSCQATFDISDLLAALKRVAPISTEQNKKCKLEFTEERLKLITGDEGSGEQGTEEISAELLEAETFTVTFNIKYLEEILQNISPSDTVNNLVTMFFVSPDRAALIKPKSEQESLIMILMPIRSN